MQAIGKMDTAGPLICESVSQFNTPFSYTGRSAMPGLKETKFLFSLTCKVIVSAYKRRYFYVRKARARLCGWVTWFGVPSTHI
jgi:hypothetical protein